MDENQNQTNDQAADNNMPQDGEEQTEKLKKERAEYLDGWQRARAELINYKKEEAKRFDEFRKFSNEMIITELIVVLDSFDLALATLEKDGKAEKGLYLIKAQLEDIMKNYGLEKLNVSVGEAFDPMKAEAVAEIESDKPSGTIVEGIETGYALHGKLIRPARVKISK